jgi:hypothetical protein
MSAKFVAKKEYIKSDLGHWKYTGDNVDLAGHFGFVYLVINKTRNKFYIGKKQLWSYKKNTHTKTGKALWRAYDTSSTHVKADKKKGDELEYIMLGVFKTRAWCNYTEAWLQMALRAITDRDDNGERRWYNNQVAAIRFIPKQDDEQHETMDKTLEKARRLIRIIRKENVIIT